MQLSRDCSLSMPTEFIACIICAPSLLKPSVSLSEYHRLDFDVYERLLVVIIIWLCSEKVTRLLFSFEVKVKAAEQDRGKSTVRLLIVLDDTGYNTVKEWLIMFKCFVDHKS